MRLSLFAALYFLSGAAALVYEVAWNRMLAGTLGSSSYTLAVVLCAYMAGLALGSRVFGARADQSSSPLRLYGWLEVGISLWVLAVPWLLVAVGWINRWLYPAFSGHIVWLLGLRCLLSFVVLLVPTTLMGGTYPALGRAAAGAGTIGHRAAVLYAANTAGAVLGTLWCGFDGISRLGVRGATSAALLISLSVGLTSVLISRRFQAPPLPQAEVHRGGWPAAVPLVCVFASGLATLALEVVWTRVLSAVVACTSYAFSALLAVFLIGIALGSVVASGIVRRVYDPLRWLGIVGAAAGLSAVLSIAFLGQFHTPVGVVPSAFGSGDWYGYVLGLFGDAARLALPTTFLSGALIPLATEALSRRGVPAGRALARVYSWNTMGALTGAPLAGFLLIPALGRFALVVGCLGLALALANLLLRRSWPSAAVTAAAATVLFLADTTTPVAVRQGLFEGKTIRYYREGPTCTVAVIEDRAQGRTCLYTDSFMMAGVGPGCEYMRVLAHLPALLLPSAQRAAIIGFGTGTSAATLALYPLDSIDIIEITRDVTDAAPYFLDANRGILGRSAGRPRIRLIHEDGKTWLDATNERYDIIISEPPLPSLSGAVNLYSREFYQGVRRCLRPEGLYVQWLPIHGILPGDGPSLVQSFLDVFPNGRASFYRETAFLVSGPDCFDTAGIRMLSQVAPIRSDLDLLGLSRPEDLLGSFLLDGDDLRRYAADAPAVTDDRPWVEFFRPDPLAARAFQTNLGYLLGSAALRPLPVAGIDKDRVERSRRSWYLACRGLEQWDLAYALRGEERLAPMQEALALYEEAIRLDPGNTLAEQRLAGIMASLNAPPSSD